MLKYHNTLVPIKVDNVTLYSRMIEINNMGNDAPRHTRAYLVSEHLAVGHTWYSKGVLKEEPIYSGDKYDMSNLWGITERQTGRLIVEAHSFFKLETVIRCTMALVDAFAEMPPYLYEVNNQGAQYRWVNSRDVQAWKRKYASRINETVKYLNNDYRGY